MLEALEEQLERLRLGIRGIHSYRQLCNIGGESSSLETGCLVSEPAMPPLALSKSPPLLESKYALGQDAPQLLALSPRRIL